MAKRRTDSNRRDLATWLMMLLPGFMFVGLLAPAAVKREAEGARRRSVRSRSAISRRAADPVLAPARAARRCRSRRSSRCSRARATSSTRRSASFEFDVKADDDEQADRAAAEDSVENYVAETLFEAPIEGERAARRRPRPALGSVRVRRDPRPDRSQRTHAVGRFPRHERALPDRSRAAATVIPEPATGGLLAIGLAALRAVRRKRA